MKIFLVFLFFIEIAFAKNNCAIPESDNLQSGRRADITGKVFQIEEKILIVKTAGKTIRLIKLPASKTNIISELGGFISPKELKLGNKVKVWTSNCKVIKKQKVVNADKIVVEK